MHFVTFFLVAQKKKNVITKTFRSEHIEVKQNKKIWLVIIILF